MNLDIWGEDIEESPLVFETGDCDGLLRPTERGFMPMPWLEAPTALCRSGCFTWMAAPIRAIHGRRWRGSGPLHRKGLTPVVATELEFFLIDDSGTKLRVPPSPLGQAPHREILSLRALDAFDGFFTALYEACEVMDIPADTAISEAGPGQFEINLMHQADPLKAADDTWLFKMLVKGLARQHGFAASFMAKPYDLWSNAGCTRISRSSTRMARTSSTMAPKRARMRCGPRWRAVWRRCRDRR
ncbi:hypothetical protein [Rhodobacter capsulatus]|uniref:hypothetical protein n=1 Tax=Rhodobacter capsulatus TaxID=1061 RepID=UPI004025E705